MFLKDRLSDEDAVKLVKTASTAVRSTLRVENANFCFISPEDFPLCKKGRFLCKITLFRSC